MDPAGVGRRRSRYILRGRLRGADRAPAPAVLGRSEDRRGRLGPDRHPSAGLGGREPPRPSPGAPCGRHIGPGKPSLDLPLMSAELRSISSDKLPWGVLSFVLIAVATSAADALRIGGSQLPCGCDRACWCQRPVVTACRWVVPRALAPNGSYP